VQAGAADTTLQVAGANFVSGSMVTSNGNNLATTYNSATSLSAVLPAASLTAGAAVQIAVDNPGAAASAAETFDVNSPMPVLTSIAPTSITAGSAATTVTLTGSGFETNSAVQVNGSAVATAYVSATSLTVSLTAAQLAQAGAAALTVVNPAPAGGSSAGVNLQIVLPVVPATVASLAPSSVQAGAGDTTVQVTGANFVSGAVVTFNGTNLTTTFNSSTSLSAVIPAASLAAGEAAQVAVVNPGVGASASVTFDVNSPAPTLTAVSPTAAVVGTAGTFTLTGSGFESNSVVQVNGSAAAATFVSATSLTVNLTAVQLGQGGTAALTVVNPAPAGGTSAAVNLTVNQATPVIASVSPASIAAGSGDVALTITGSGFSSAATVTANSTALAITGQAATSMAATLPAALVAQAGTITVVVSNPGTNAESSGPQSVTIVGAPVISYLTPTTAAMGGAGFTLTVVGSNFQPNSVIEWNGVALNTTYSVYTGLSATVPAADIATSSPAMVTVATPVAYPVNPGMLVSAPQLLSTYLSLPNNDMIYDPINGYLYVSVPASAGGSLSNAVVGIDPATGNVVQTIAVGSNPNQIAISSDGTQLFVGLDGAGSVGQYNLSTGQLEEQFGLGTGIYGTTPPYTAAALAAVPGEPISVAVLDTSGNVRIFDSGVARSESLTNSNNNILDGSFGSLSFGPSAATLYADIGSLPGLEDLTVGATGITAGSTLVSNVGSDSIQYDNGWLYVGGGFGTGGTVFDATTGTQLGTFLASANTPAAGPMVSDSTLGLAFVADVEGTLPGVFAFNEGTLALEGIVPFNIAYTPLPEYPHQIVRWGQDGLAVATPAQIYLLQSSVVKDLSGSPADVGVTLSAPATATTGRTLTWTTTVTNNGPNAASGVTLTSTLADSLVVQSVTPSQGSCPSGSEFSCDLGSLASGASATVTITTVPTTAGSIETTSTVASVSYDPTLVNNEATATTTVTGALYGAVPTVTGISPNLVQAGSAAFTLTVTGSGLNATSTVQVNGVAEPTTLVNDTEVTAEIPATAIANYGWAPVTVVNPSPGGGISPVTPLTIYALVNVPANEMAIDPFTRKLYATLPSTSTLLAGNSVVAIDPTSGSVGTPVNVGSEPNVMAETTDGKYLWIGVSGANSLSEFNLETQQLQATIPLMMGGGPVTAYGLSAMPGSDTTLAVVYTDSNSPISAILDLSGSAGTFRTNTAGTGYDLVFASPTELYTYEPSLPPEFYRFSVDTSGLNPIDQSQMDGLGDATPVFPIVLADGLVYGAAGGIVNPATTPPSQVGTLSTMGLTGAAVAADPANGNVFLVLEQTVGINEPEFTLARYSTATDDAQAEVNLSNVNEALFGRDVLRWGQDGLAVRISTVPIGQLATSQILLMRGPFVLPSELQANPAPGLTSASATTIAANSGNTMLTLTGTGFLPGAVALWNGSPRTTTYVSATQLSAAIAAADVASAGSETVMVENPGSAASGSVTITVQ
jgi:uncharacterized repeat protein (TIGR01451 family)